MKIPYNKIYLTGKEIQHICKSIEGQIDYVNLMEKYVKNILGSPKVLMTPSCTSALELAYSLMDMNKDDEVILPSYTYTSTANAFLKMGVKPIFADIDETTLNICPNEIANKVTNRTKVISLVHYGGISCDINIVKEIAKDNNIIILEDAAQAFGAKYNNKFLGTLGQYGCYSFHSTKNFTCQQGGALTINEDNKIIIDIADKKYYNGTNKVDFINNLVDNYSWVSNGSNYQPTSIDMAFLYPQINNYLDIINNRQTIFEYYQKSLSSYIGKGHIMDISNVPSYSTSNYHIFYILFESNDIRETVRKKLLQQNINAYTHYEPLHCSKMGYSYGYKKGNLPITEKVANNILRLPLYTNMTSKEYEYVINKLTEILKIL